MSEQQLELFTEEQCKRVEEIDKPEGVKVQWSKAQDRRIWNMFVGLVEWALFAPVTLQRGQGWVGGDMVEDRWGDIVIERLVRVHKWTQELYRESEEAQRKADLQEAYRRLVDLKDQTQERLTNWEVCFVLMECSLAAPLSHYMFQEYMRAFAHCFGMEGYMKVHGRFEPLRVGDLRSARYEGKVQRRFPPLDDEELAWIEDFNRRGMAARWPGTDKTVVVGE